MEKKKKMYNLFKGEDLKIAEKILQRRRQILYHSCIYYEFDETIVSDHKWAEWAHELVDLQEQYPNISMMVPLTPYFKGFDGSTGFDLPIDADWVQEKTRWILDRWNKCWRDREVDISYVRRRLSEINKIHTKEQYDEMKSLLDQADQVYYTI